MKTKSRKQDKINIVTLGCSKNTVDSEVMLTQLKAGNLNVFHEDQKDDANIVIINTCGFIDHAKKESIDTILDYTDRKLKGSVDKVYVTGCLSHRYKDELETEIPEVDAWFGTLDLPRLLNTLGVDYKKELVGERLLTTPVHYAYLKISEGCNRPCSFCAIPLMRGKHVSKPIEQLVLEAKGLVKTGTKELLIIAQDSTYYGLDLYGERKLADLLKRLSEVEGVEWIRLHYAYPSQFPIDAIDVMANTPNICKYLDMPLQHISDRMLKIMRRGITKKRTIELIAKLRGEIPELALRTTMLVGHPGETEEDFEELMEFVKESRFDRLGVFTYSHEDQTHAGSLVDDVPQAIKEARAERLMALQEEVSFELNQLKVGKVYKVLFDRVEGGFFVGRTEHDSPEVDNEVLVPVNQFVRIGDFAMVKIKEATAFDLYGDLIND